MGHLEWETGMTPEQLAIAVREGRLDRAAAELEGAVAAAQRGGGMKQSADLWNDLGVVYYLAARMEDSRGALERAYASYLQLNDRAGQGRALGNLARVAERCGDRDRALMLYAQAADLLHEAKQPADEFATLRSLSQLYLRLGGWIQALATFDRALTIKPGRGLLEAFLHVIYQIPLRMIGVGSA